MDTIVNKPFLAICSIFCLLAFKSSVLIQCVELESFRVNSFSIDESESFVDYHSLDKGNSFRSKRDADEVTETESEKDDPKCEAQKESFSKLRNELKAGQRLEETHVFSNESKFNLALAWAGNDDDGTLIVLTTASGLPFVSSSKSTLWRSTDHGRHWVDESKKVHDETFRKDDGLQRNPHNPKKVYLISYQHFIYTTENGGTDWGKMELVVGDDQTTLSVDEILEFHGDSAYEDYVAVIDNQRRLFVTYDNFQKQPTIIKSKNVHAAKWGTMKSMTQEYLYALTGNFKVPLYGAPPPLLTLERYDKKTTNWKEILHKVISFNVEGKFMYASIYKSDEPKNEEADRLMMISTDGGTTWKEAQLPTLHGDRFFSVLDMSEDLIFMHVDDPGDTGQGVLYTSASKGIVYSESLTNHLFPNFNTVHDFYKIKSIRGVYLASQMGTEKSIHTVITYTQGAEWKNVSRPLNVQCENAEKLGCTLQIHNMYSIHRGIKARLPHSTPQAPGLVLVHAHVASNLQVSKPDVYLSTDGGYNFKKVLKGPHAYEIADSGGLIVAVPLSSDTPDIIKFSTDEGNCWHTYQFTKDNIKFTGLLTEPGGKSMTVSIWGYQVDSKKWTINTIDFNRVVTKPCNDDDYVDWMPHVGLGKSKEQVGCMLGLRETFKKIKSDSWCQNGYFKATDSAAEVCPCSKDDYECDFGFYRRFGEEECRRQPEIPAAEIEICNGNKLEKIVSVGYRKLPGDVCDHGKGFTPVSSFEDVIGACKAGDKSAITHDEIAPKKTSPMQTRGTTPTTQTLTTNTDSTPSVELTSPSQVPKTSSSSSGATGSNSFIIGAIVTVVLIVVGLVGAFFLYKMILLRRHKVVYRYSMLNQPGEDGANEFENSLANHDTLYHDTSDEEVEEENRSPSRRSPNAKPDTGNPGYHDDSDDDMLG